MKIKTKLSIALVWICGLLLFCSAVSAAPDTLDIVKNDGKPKIVNIVNFIRLIEPREAHVTEDVLYQTVVKQVEMMKAYKLGGTFLLQYDALMDPRYQRLLKALPQEEYEIGGWWELPQPLIEKAGLKWRGRYAWDWHADVGFSTGYTPEEREKIIDVYMADFKKIFGYYPKSVASWFIDSHSLNYMYEKYKIVASANCKDQYGTDGYTLWGGYWNQAYYPSKLNSYMPAQNKKNQTPVPIFRMLGSDPVRQYDTGISTTWQGVITLEPVYPEAGGSEKWVNWFLKEFVEGESMVFNYTQAGQENSFTWDAMKKGFEIQLPLIARLRDENKVRVETMEASGLWFKKNFKLTPATSFTVNKDLGDSDKKTVWFNSRFYRTNLLWEDGGLRVRDIHIFDENFPSVYTTQKATSNECAFYTLPVVDGYLWSKKDQLAGLRFKAVVDGKEILLTGADPVITNTGKGKLHISWPLNAVEGNVEIDLDEKKFKIRFVGRQPLDWYLDLSTADQIKLPFKNISPKRLDAEFEGMKYNISSIVGQFSTPNNGSVLRISPENGKIILNMTNGK
ncbi:hypothetical protein [Sphingobacterium puteale]|uniref:hypothetical protein n=1 Tax=Sphingobacterium puteale TaxID=2420510 RepID=UPI003D96CBAB